MTAATAPAVTVYSTATCPWCEKAKSYLKANNVPYTEKMVDQDQAAAIEMIRKTGQQGVPVITADNDVIIGFDQARLARIVKRYSASKRPPLGLLAADAESFLRKRPELAQNYPENVRGIYVGEVRPSSVAEAAGIKPGDIIVSAANKRVRDLAGLDQLIDLLKAGDTLTIRFYRGHEEQTTTLQF